jgi:predicted homoserine dehydrogenase-like protein
LSPPERQEQCVPHRRDADAYVAEAKRRNMNPRMLVEFVDGSKTMVEMVALANATGLVPDIPGMHGPSAPVDALHRMFCPRDEGGLLARKGVVDFTVAPGVAPGVFASPELRHPRLRERMSDLQLGDGPYYTVYRPYHLTSLEVPLSAAAAVLYGPESHAAAARAFRGGRCARQARPRPWRDARRDRRILLSRFALSRADALAFNALPLGLAQGASVTRRIPKGDYLTYANCAPDERQRIVQVRREQDEWVRLAAGGLIRDASVQNANFSLDPRSHAPASVPSSRRSTPPRCAPRLRRCTSSASSRRPQRPLTCAA